MDYSAEPSRSKKDPTVAGTVGDDGSDMKLLKEKRQRRLEKELGYPFDSARVLRKLFGDPNGAEEEEEAVPL
jgi:hypothetical protein